jgi:hypothetical protein
MSYRTNIKNFEKEKAKCLERIDFLTQKIMELNETLKESEKIDIEISDTITIYYMSTQDRHISYCKYIGKVPKCIIDNKFIYHQGYYANYCEIRLNNTNLDENIVHSSKLLEAFEHIVKNSTHTNDTVLKENITFISDSCY